MGTVFNSSSTKSTCSVFLLSFSLAPPWLPLRLIMDMAVTAVDMADMAVMDMAVDTADMVVIIVASDLLMPNPKPNPPLLLRPKLHLGTAMEDTDTAVDTAMAVMAVMDMAVDTTGVRPQLPK